MPKEVSKLRESETPEEKALRVNRAKRNRFIVVLSIDFLLIALIIFQIIWMLVR